MIYGLVAPGYEMADVAAANLDRRPIGRSPGFDMSTKLKLMGVDVASFGDPFAEADGTRALTYEDPFGGVYKKLVFNREGHPPAGRHSGRRRLRVRHAARAVQERQAAHGPARRLCCRRARTAACGGDADAQVCSCNNVSERQIREAVRGPEAHDGRPGQGVHARPAPAAAAACRGSPTCSRPSSRRSARRVDNQLCEHFPHSRQELFQIVMIKEIKTFERPDRLARPRAWAARSASRPSPRSWPASGTKTSSTRPTRRFRTPTTASSPTSSAAACIPSSRASPAARSRPRS